MWFGKLPVLSTSETYSRPLQVAQSVRTSAWNTASLNIAQRAYDRYAKLHRTLVESGVDSDPQGPKHYQESLEHFDKLRLAAQQTMDSLRTGSSLVQLPITFGRTTKPTTFDVLEAEKALTSLKASDDDAARTRGSEYLSSAEERWAKYSIAFQEEYIQELKDWD